MAKKEQDPTEALLDFFLYAPVGIALEAVDNLPKYVERGKSQVTIGRFLAKTAAKKGTSTIEDAGERVMNDIGQVFADFFGIDLSADDDVVDAEVVGEPTSIAERTDAHLAIDEYDTQAAAQIVKLLAQLTPEELADVESYESENRKRVTILRKITQLRDAS